LLEAFRKEIKALDPCIAEEFLNLSMAHRLVTDFVDAALGQTISLLINISFSDICRGGTNLGLRANGGVEVRYSNLEDLPYHRPCSGDSRTEARCTRANQKPDRVEAASLRRSRRSVGSREAPASGILDPQAKFRRKAV